jgi:hypothetical protein
MRIGRSIAAGALALSLLPLAASAAPAAAAPTTATDISFDGYCDGLHLNQPSVGAGTSATVDGNIIVSSCIGAPESGLLGQASPNKLGKYGVTKGNEYISYEDNTDYSYFTVLKKNNTWTHYVVSVGGRISVLNSGTWSLGAPARTAGRTSSFSGAAKTQVSAPAAVDTRIDISFDGFCDGMTLKIPSAGLHIAGTIDGHATGCYSQAVMGGVAKVNGLTAWFVSTVVGGTTLQYAIFSDGTWANYYVSGGVIVPIFTGTWSYGTPVARGVGSSG